MKLRLDIDLISEECYRALVEEFNKQFGVGLYDEWEITVEDDSVIKCNCLAPVKLDGESQICGNCYNIL